MEILGLIVVINQGPAKSLLQHKTYHNNIYAVQTQILADTEGK